MRYMNNISKLKSTKNKFALNQIKIGNKCIGDGFKPFIISEIGTNFQSLEEAKIMIELSAKSGADAVKFQTYKAERLATPGAFFPLKNGKKISQYDYFKKTELSEKNHKILMKHAQKKNILFISTPSNKEDVDFLDNLGVPAFKTGSDDLTNLSLLQHIAQKNKPMIISTGMSSIKMIKKSIKCIFDTGNKKVILLHCTVGYPAKIEDANLKAIETMRKELNQLIGYSDHTLGFTAPIVATALGACVIEKHVAFDKTRGGPDNDVAIDIKQFSQLVFAINKSYISLGTGKKEIASSEKAWVNAARKSIYTAVDINNGEIITLNKLITKRPANGIPANNIFDIVGKKAKVNLNANHLLKHSDII